MLSHSKILESLHVVKTSLASSTPNDYSPSNCDTIIETLSALSVQLQVYKSFQHIAKHLIQTHSPSTSSSSNEETKTRWFTGRSKLNKLLAIVFKPGNLEECKNEEFRRLNIFRTIDPATFIFIAVSYSPRELVRINQTHFEYVIKAAGDFLSCWNLPDGWIFQRDFERIVTAYESVGDVKAFVEGMYLWGFGLFYILRTTGLSGADG